MASACLSDVHNYTSSVCSFPQWQAEQGFSGLAGRKRCNAGSSFHIHYNTLFIKQAGLLHRIHPVMHYCRCGFYRDCGMLRVVLYQEYLAIISLSLTGQFSDLHTVCSLHLYPVYVDSCMHYEVIVGTRCVRYSNFAWGITAPVRVNGNGREYLLCCSHREKFLPVQERIDCSHTGRRFIWVLCCGRASRRERRDGRGPLRRHCLGAKEVTHFDCVISSTVHTVWGRLQFPTIV